ncbi:pentapeptide repeat-containing protein [Streptomyces sp. NPDC003717]|uniref:pentapeptide repeat-containing protein n=1 Tax=Streptomyces sp. NPDC003717 TaxID=3154276 RepID=UPI0033A7AFA9
MGNEPHDCPTSETSRSRSFETTLRQVGYWGLVSIAVAAYGLLLWKGPWVFDGAHLRSSDLQPADGVVITGFRTSVVALGAGAIAALGLYYTHKSHRQTEHLFDHTREKDREQAELTREGQVTDRYVAAIKLLGSTNLTECLGGVYALERIMHDSPKDHETVVNVLAAFVRQHARLGLHPEGEPVRSEVLAAVLALGRRPSRSEITPLDLTHVQLGKANLWKVDLRGARFGHSSLVRCDLAAAQLQETSFANADLTGARLTGASLMDADFTSANLAGARLSMARLGCANLSGAVLARTDFRAANLTGAIAVGARFSGSGLRYVDLSDVDLRSADLHEAEGLTAEQLCKAWIDDHTVLPSDLARDEHVRQRIAECSGGGHATLEV